MLYEVITLLLSMTKQRNSVMDSVWSNYVKSAPMTLPTKLHVEKASYKKAEAGKKMKYYPSVIVAAWVVLSVSLLTLCPAIRYPSIFV